MEPVISEKGRTTISPSVRRFQRYMAVFVLGVVLLIHGSTLVTGDNWPRGGSLDRHRNDSIGHRVSRRAPKRARATVHASFCLDRNWHCAGQQHCCNGYFPPRCVGLAGKPRNKARRGTRACSAARDSAASLIYKSRATRGSWCVVAVPTLCSGRAPPGKMERARR